VGVNVIVPPVLNSMVSSISGISSGTGVIIGTNYF
jgi:hypothetical protein